MYPACISGCAARALWIPFCARAWPGRRKCWFPATGRSSRSPPKWATIPPAISSAAFATTAASRPTPTGKNIGTQRTSLWTGEQAPPPLPHPQFAIVALQRYRLQSSFAHWAYYGLFRAPRAAFVRPLQFPLKSCGFPGAETAKKRFLLWKMGFSGAKIAPPPPYTPPGTIKALPPGFMLLPAKSTRPVRANFTCPRKNSEIRCR